MRLPLLGTKAALFLLCKLKQLECFVLGSNRLPLCQRNDNAPCFLLGQVGVPITTYLAAKYLWV